MTSNPTRRSLHGIAELVLAGPQHRATGEIALRVTEDGFATAFAPELRFDGGTLIAGDQRVAVADRSYANVAAAVGLVAGEPAGVYGDGAGLDPDELIVLDPTETRVILDAFRAGDEALRRFAPDADPILWPEHFDIGITLGAVNYGVAPGDDQVPEPYAYVGPHTPRDGEFWNVPFGAARPMRTLATTTAVVEFFTTGRRLAG